jgi:hypothetical protein
MANFPDWIDDETRAAAEKYKATVDGFAEQVNGRPVSPETKALKTELIAKLEAIVTDLEERPPTFERRRRPKVDRLI